MYGGGVWGSPPATDVYPHEPYVADHAAAAHSAHEWLERGGDLVLGTNEDESSRWHLDGSRPRATQLHPALAGMPSADVYQAACAHEQRQQQQPPYFCHRALSYDQPGHQQHSKQHFLAQQATVEAAAAAQRGDALYRVQSPRQQMQMQLHMREQLQLQPQMPFPLRGPGGASAHSHVPMQSPIEAHDRFGSRAHGAAPAKLDLASLDFEDDGYGGHASGFNNSIEPLPWPLPPLSLGGSDAFGGWGSCGSASVSRSSESTPSSTPVHSVQLSPLTLSQPEPIDTTSLTAALAADLDLPGFFAGLGSDEDELTTAGVRRGPLGAHRLTLEFDSADAGVGARLDVADTARALDLVHDGVLALGASSEFGDEGARRESVARKQGAPRGSPVCRPTGPSLRAARSVSDGWVLETLVTTAAVEAHPSFDADSWTRPRSHSHPEAAFGVDAIPTIPTVRTSESSGGSFGSSASSAQTVEASSYTVKLRGLPYRATMQEIRSFFDNLKIAPHGIRISINAHGRPSGEATVQFACSQTAQRALKKDRHFMGGRYIEVFAQPSSEPPRTEPAIRSPRAVAVAPAEAIVNSPRTTNLSARPRANSAQLDGAPASGAAEPHHEFIVKMRGLPFKASARDVVGFFGGAGGTQLAESAVHFGLNAHGRPTGEASVRFPSAEAMQHAMTKHMKPMGTRYIELFEVGKAPAQSRTARRRELELMGTA